MIDRKRAFLIKLLITDLIYFFKIFLATFSLILFDTTFGEFILWAFRLRYDESSHIPSVTRIIQPGNDDGTIFDRGIFLWKKSDIGMRCIKHAIFIYSVYTRRKSMLILMFHLL